ncbi:MAG: N-acetylneuraminate synthase family protein [Candidatus Omnitrophota bacterium]
MKHTVDFNKLFIFEMANNHMGDLDHAVRIIREVRKATKGFDFNFAFKLQYRDLDTFIHPDFKGRQDIKYVKRFEETKLGVEKLKRLKEEIVKNGFIPVCTPFDEPSVDLIEEHGFAIIKIGSCSFSDWPLLERVALTDKPLILSLGGAALEDMDKVVIFLEHRGKSFCLMHCVGEYPTAKENLQLNQIDFIRQRYPGVPVGYSTHEDPLNMESVKMAVAKGALVFERHVGVAAGPYALNKYSSTPEQIGKWLQSAQEALKCAVPLRGKDKFPQRKKKTSSD